MTAWGAFAKPKTQQDIEEEEAEIRRANAALLQLQEQRRREAYMAQFDPELLFRKQAQLDAWLHASRYELQEAFRGLGRMVHRLNFHCGEMLSLGEKARVHHQWSRLMVKKDAASMAAIHYYRVVAIELMPTYTEDPLSLSMARKREVAGGAVMDVVKRWALIQSMVNYLWVEARVITDSDYALRVRNWASGLNAPGSEIRRFHQDLAHARDFLSEMCVRDSSSDIEREYYRVETAFNRWVHDFKLIEIECFYGSGNLITAARNSPLNEGQSERIHLLHRIQDALKFLWERARDLCRLAIFHVSHFLQAENRIYKRQELAFTDTESGLEGIVGSLKELCFPAASSEISVSLKQILEPHIQVFKSHHHVISAAKETILPELAPVWMNRPPETTALFAEWPRSPPGLAKKAKRREARDYGDEKQMTREQKRELRRRWKEDKRIDEEEEEIERALDWED